MYWQNSGLGGLWYTIPATSSLPCQLTNAVVKGSGGAIGLTGNPGALRRWMVAGREIAGITTEFE